MGLVSLDLTLSVKFKEDDKETTMSTTSITTSSSKMHLSPSSNIKNKRAPYQLWQCVLNVVLVEGSNLLSMDDNGLSDPYVKFRLENERYRSKTVRYSLNPRFLEQFQLYIYDINKSVLHVSVYDYDSAGPTDDFMGKGQIDLKMLELEKTHFVKMPLEDGAGTISMLLTITATYGAESPSDIDYSDEALRSNTHRDSIIRKYVIKRVFYRFKMLLSKSVCNVLRAW